MGTIPPRRRGSGPAFPLPEKPAAAPGAHVRAPHLPSRSPTPRRTQKRHLVLAIPGALGGGANAGITALQAMSDRAAAAAAISTGLTARSDYLISGSSRSDCRSKPPHRDLDLPA